MAIDRDPAHRYQTAGELAADLQRYLADEPIRARRLSPAARLIRWCRKNRAIAALIGLAASLLVLVVLILFVSQIQLTHQRNQLRGALGQSLVAEARFRRASGEMGQRAEGLRNLVAAAQYRPAQELRDDAIRCLALHDLDTEAEWPAAMSNPTPDSIAFDPPLSHYVSYGDETVEIRRTPGAGEAAGQVVQRLPLGKLVARAARFSRDGSVLAVRGDDAGTSRLIVWRWREARQLLDVENAAERAFDVDDSGERLVCGLRDGTMRTYDLITGAILAAWKLPHQPNTARFEQAGPRVACSIPEAYCVQVYDSRNGDQHHEIPFGEDIYALAWHPDGDRLAVGRGFDVCVVRLQEPSVPAFLPIGHRWMIHAVEYHPSGEFLVSHCLREGVTRLWDMRTRRELLLAQGNFIRFDETGAALALLHTDRLKRTRFLGEAEYQTLADGVLEGRDSWRAVFHPTLPVIIDCGRDGIRCWDIRRRRLLAAMPREMIRTACFEPATHDLLTAGDKGLRRWKLEIDRDVLHAAISPPQTLVFTDGSISAPTTLAQGLCSTPDGSFRVAAFKDHPYLYLQEVASARIRRLPCNSRIAFVAISPTGRWIAAGNYQHPGFYVWDAQRDQPAKELDAQSNAGQVAFSPDGKWLIACANDRYLLFEVGSWRLHAEIARPTLVEGSAAFSPNSQVLALSMGPRVVQIREVAAGRILATLDSGRDPVNFLNVQFHPQHGDIISAASGAYGIRLWNLAQTRRALAEMKLDW
jgi:WD40 repeat protein